MARKITRDPKKRTKQLAMSEQVTVPNKEPVMSEQVTAPYKEPFMSAKPVEPVETLKPVEKGGLSNKVKRIGQDPAYTPGGVRRREMPSNFTAPIQGIAQPKTSITQANTDDNFFNKYYDGQEQWANKVLGPLQQYAMSMFDVKGAEKRAEREQKVAKIQAITEAMRSVADIFYAPDALVTQHDQSGVLRSIENYRQALNNIDTVKQQREAAMLENGIRSLTLWDNMKQREMQQQGLDRTAKHQERMETIADDELAYRKQKDIENFAIDNEQRRIDNEIKRYNATTNRMSAEAAASARVDTAAARLIKAQAYADAEAKGKGDKKNEVRMILDVPDGTVPVTNAQYIDILQSAANDPRFDSDLQISKLNYEGKDGETATDIIVARYAPEYYYYDQANNKLEKIEQGSGFMVKPKYDINDDESLKEWDDDMSTVMTGRDDDTVKLEKLITLYRQLNFEKDAAKKYAKQDLDNYKMMKAASEKYEAASAERDKLLGLPLVREQK
jgi:hypothetical protein